MAFTSKTYTTAEVDAAITADPVATLIITERKKEGKVYKGGTQYFDSTYVVGGNRPVACAIYAREVRVVRGPEDPANPTHAFDDKKEGDAKREVVIGISHNHSGGYGPLVRKINDARDNFFDKTFPQWKKEKKFPMFSERYPSTAHKDYKDKQYQDPVDKTKVDFRSNLVLDFGSFGNETYIPAEKRGKPKCLVKDFTTGKLNEKTQQIEYDLLLVDGAPVNETNAWKVFQSGTILEELYVVANNTSKSKFGIATKQMVSEVVVSVRAEFKPIDIQREQNVDLLAKIKAVQDAKNQAAANAIASPAVGASTTAATNSTTTGATNSTTVVTPPAPANPALDPAVLKVLDGI